MSAYDNFVQQLNAMTERIANDGAEEINRAANFILSIKMTMEHFSRLVAAASNQPSTSGSMGQPPTSRQPK
uniref:Uncharacterized protein n=1 Tax=Globodera pallida TaxID=36090 RepID=A0A183CBG5_GLOPA